MSRHLQKRTYQDDGYYHIFNRGNNKQPIFLDVQDYLTFVHMLEFYLSREVVRPQWIKRGFEKDIAMIAFCLMPNHFHLLVQQSSQRGISPFLQAFSLKYTKYFNKKYERVGHVFQGVFKARLIESDADLLNTSRYVHCNAEDIVKDIYTYPFSTAQYFVTGGTIPQWIHPEKIFDVLHGVFGTPKNKWREVYKNYLLH